MELSQFDDKGYVGFTENSFKASPHDKKAIVTLKRFDGSKGEVSALVSTHTSEEQMSKVDVHGGRIGQEHVDFTSLQRKIVHFDEGQVEAELEIALLTENQ